MGEVGNLVGFSWDFVGFHKENHDLMRTYEDEPTEMMDFFGTSGRFCSLDFVTRTSSSSFFFSEHVESFL